MNTDTYIAILVNEQADYAERYKTQRVTNLRAAKVWATKQGFDTFYLALPGRNEFYPYMKSGREWQLRLDRPATWRVRDFGLMTKVSTILDIINA